MIVVIFYVEPIRSNQLTSKVWWGSIRNALESLAGLTCKEQLKKNGNNPQLD